MTCITLLMLFQGGRFFPDLNFNESIFLCWTMVLHSQGHYGDTAPVGGGDIFFF